MATGVAEIVPGIHRIESPLGTRRLAVWLVSGTEGTLLLDTGIAGTVTAHVAPALAALGVEPRRLVQVLITHADVDHYGGNAEIRALAPRAAIRAHRLDRPLIESWDAISAERYGWYRRHGLDYDEATWSWLEAAAGPDTELDGELEPGEIIDLGGIRLEVLHLPGHSLGHLGVHEPKTGTAIVSDAVMGHGFDTMDGTRAGPPPYVDLGAYRATISCLRELAPVRLGTAHFPLFDGEQVGRFLDLSQHFTAELDAALTRELEAGRDSVAALLDPVAEELGGYPEMQVELARSIGAHLDARATG